MLCSHANSKPASYCNICSWSVMQLVKTQTGQRKTLMVSEKLDGSGHLFYRPVCLCSCPISFFVWGLFGQKCKKSGMDSSETNTLHRGLKWCDEGFHNSESYRNDESKLQNFFIYSCSKVVQHIQHILVCVWLATGMTSHILPLVCWAGFSSSLVSCSTLFWHTYCTAWVLMSVWTWPQAASGVFQLWSLT